MCVLFVLLLRLTLRVCVLKQNIYIYANKSKKQRQHDTWPVGQFRRRQSQRILNCRICKNGKKKNIINKYKFILHIVDEAFRLLLLLLMVLVVVVVCVFPSFFLCVAYTPLVVVAFAAAGGALSTSFYEGSQHFSIYFQCFSQQKNK